MSHSYFAHTATLPDGSAADPSQWESLQTHLSEVAELAAEFTSAFGARDWGHLAGHWHDLGKYSSDFQNYLRQVTGVADPHGEDVASSAGRVDHSTAGAQHAAKQGPLGHLLSYVIAGHHAGLPDGIELRERLLKKIPHWEASAPEQLKSGELTMPPLNPICRDKNLGPFRCATFVRMVFSSLVDADFLCTERFMSPDAAAKRPQWPVDILDRMEAALISHLDRFGEPRTPVDHERQNVRQACESAAALTPGFFDLTVPTGGGKTLSSLLFAIRHARLHGLRRVIYTIPFTSIIEQNAQVFRQVFQTLSEEIGCDVVLEHHSNLLPDRETTRNRLTSENWDAPLIVTTNVQLFDSLFACRTSASRKAHRLAKAVLVLDEAQALPVGLLRPILATLRSLALDFGTSVVLCTATQPALEQREAFTPGIPPQEIRPIIENRQALYERLRRTELTSLGSIDNATLLEHVLEEESGALVICNTTKAARDFYETLPSYLPRFHLSARMCPKHRTTVLDDVRAKLKARERVVLVSTQLIEAGVDVSFPAVFRAECGLDSLAQAAGRCNRNGELQDPDGAPILGRVYAFRHEGYEIPNRLVDLRDSANHGAEIAALYPDDLLSLQAIEHFFRLHIWGVGARTNQWDQPKVMDCFPNDPKALQFRKAAADFRMIDSNTHSLVIPFGEEGEQLCQDLRNREKLGIPPARVHYRTAQRFVVQVYEHEWKVLLANHRIESLYNGAFHLLLHPENNYDRAFGLKPSDSPDSPSAFFV